jgi:hypothetical protein
MDQHWLDDLARSMAGGHSRRTVLRRLGGGLAAAAMASLLPQVALSAKACPKPLTDCGGTCVDTSGDLTNCGKCGASCSDGDVCVRSKCQPPTLCGTVTCQAGQACCGTACVNLATDEQNCGKCGVVCAAGETCVVGKCQATVTCGTITCLPGESCCGTACVDLATDPNNCGTCGNACDPEQNFNGVASCSKGVCEFTPGP